MIILMALLIAGASTGFAVQQYSDWLHYPRIAHGGRCHGGCKEQPSFGSQ
jgi:hypothetical protein